jgi:hypothetical protein
MSGRDTDGYEYFGRDVLIGYRCGSPSKVEIYILRLIDRAKNKTKNLLSKLKGED